LNYKVKIIQNISKKLSKKKSFFFKTMRNYYFILFIIFLFACKSEENQSENQSIQANKESVVDSTFLCVPCKSVGKITSATSEADLVKWFGRENVITEKQQYDGGEYVLTTIFRGTTKELGITWQNEEKLIGVSTCSVDTSATQWELPLGIKPSTPLSKLVELNGKHFSFSGFGWDYGGGIMGFEGGKLAQYAQCYGITLVEDYEAYPKLNEQETGQVVGDIKVDSDNKVLEKLNVKVSKVSIFFNPPN
jgi:hypothetical protein